MSERTNLDIFSSEASFRKKKNASKLIHKTAKTKIQEIKETECNINQKYNFKSREKYRLIGID